MGVSGSISAVCWCQLLVRHHLLKPAAFRFCIESKTFQPRSFSRLQDDLMSNHYCVSCIGCQFNTESSTRWLCWPSRVAAAPQHRHTWVVTSRLASVNRHFARLGSHYWQAVHQDRLRESSFSLFCANCLELVAWDNNQRWLTVCI